MQSILIYDILRHNKGARIFKEWQNSLSFLLSIFARLGVAHCVSEPGLLLVAQLSWLLFPGKNGPEIGEIFPHSVTRLAHGRGTGHAASGVTMSKELTMTIEWRLRPHNLHCYVKFRVQFSSNLPWYAVFCLCRASIIMQEQRLCGFNTFYERITIRWFVIY